MSPRRRLLSPAREHLVSAPSLFLALFLALFVAGFSPVFGLVDGCRAAEDRQNIVPRPRGNRGGFPVSVDDESLVFS
jgi:hypothetical protein